MDVHNATDMFNLLLSVFDQTYYHVVLFQLLVPELGLPRRVLTQLLIKSSGCGSPQPIPPDPPADSPGSEQPFPRAS